MSQISARDLFDALPGQSESPEKDPNFEAFKQLFRELCFQPPCECDICLRQYRTKDQQNITFWYYTGHVKDPAQLAQSYSKSINQDRQFVYEKISTSSISILKRWRAREAKRKELLKQAQPDIYPLAHPLIDVVSHGIMKLHDQRSHRAAYLLPYINLEDLSKDSANLIHLLHHRVSFPPEAWVHFDNSQLQPPWKQGAFAEQSADGCIIMHGPHYGTWKEFDVAAVHRGDAYGAPRGLMILEAQQLLMSFLRKMVSVILKDASPSNPQESRVAVIATAAANNFDLTGCSKWMRFIEAEPHRDQPWLSVASIYTQQPYSAPPCFDVDAMIEIAETKAMEAGDELWLLQTDLDYFHDLMKRHEREWLDSVPRIEELKMFSPKDKMDNIGYIMTVKAVTQARDWQWLLEECQTLKRNMGQAEAKTRVGESLPVEYERALCGLLYLLRNAQLCYQDSLSKLLLKSQAFQSIWKVTAVAKDHRDSWALCFSFQDYSQLYQKDRIGWCLYNLTKNWNYVDTFDRSVVLQHLERFLETCPRRELERIDQEMYKCISDIAAVERMLSILELHRPNFAILAQLPILQPSQAWKVHTFLLVKPSDLTCKTLDMGSALESSAQFRMPMGRRDEQWLVQRDRAQEALSHLWKKARHAYQMTLAASDVPQILIEPQLAMMKQSDHPHNKAQLDLERQQILSRLKAARRSALARSVIPSKDTTSGFPTQRDQPAHRIQEPAKEKTKTRPDTPSASASLDAKYAAELVIDDEIKEAEKPPPVLYTLKRNSDAFQVIPLMFPDRSQGVEEGGKVVAWLDFVSTMGTLGFSAEHRGGSAFAFKGAIRLPSDPSNQHKRSIAVHMPHPNNEMGPVLLQSLGRRCNRRFGWQRANFVADESGIGQGT